MNASLRGTCAVMGLLGLAIAGCAGAATPQDSSPATGGCAPTAAPLTAPTVAKALRRHGFAVAISRDDCAGTVINADVAEGKNSKYGLDCTVYEPSTNWGHTIRAQGPSPHSSIMWHGIKALVFLENMECQLYPRPSDQAQEMARLVAAAHDLRNAVSRTS